jgi:hypothetical protein
VELSKERISSKGKRKTFHYWINFRGTIGDWKLYFDYIPQDMLGQFFCSTSLRERENLCNQFLTELDSRNCRCVEWRSCLSSPFSSSQIICFILLFLQISFCHVAATRSYRFISVQVPKRVTSGHLHVHYKLLLGGESSGLIMNDSCPPLVDTRYVTPTWLQRATNVDEQQVL